MRSIRSVNIVAWDNGAGLSRDIDIVSAALRATGKQVYYNARSSRIASLSRSARVVRRVRKESLIVQSKLLGRRHFDVNLFLEDISPEFVPMARINMLIPNPECFRPATERSISMMDLVLAKTSDAARNFRQVANRVHLIGFTSLDRGMGRSQHHTRSALHIAGRSLLKGTDQVVRAWSKHPEWPDLFVVQRGTDYEGRKNGVGSVSSLKNVHLIDWRLSDDELMRLQNQVLFHIQPSQAEGFGHVLVEALSVGGIVVTTDAPPMNEVVEPNIGFHVSTSGCENLGLGRVFELDQTSLEEEIGKALRLPDESIAAMRIAAREAFEASVRTFEQRFEVLLSSL